MRETYYQAVGNPIQIDRLPRSRPDIEFVGLPVTGGHLGTGLFPFLVLALLAGLLGILVWRPYVWPWLNPLDLAVGLPLLLTMLWRAYSQRQIRILWHPLTLVGVGIIAMSGGVLPSVRLLLAALATGGLTFGLGWHHIALATAAPVPRSVSREKKREWTQHLIVLFLLSSLLVSVGLEAGPVLFSLGGLLLPFAALLAPPPPALREPTWKLLASSLLSWVTYEPSKIPGLLQSPLGGVSRRIGITLLATLLLAGALGEMPNTPLERISELNTSELMAIPGLLPTVVGWLLLTVLMPWSVSLSLLTPLVREIAVWQEGQSQTQSLRDVLKDVRTSADPVVRDSVYLGRVVADGSPVLVPRAVFGEHAHGLGDSGGGKTSLFLCPLIEQLGMRGDCSIIVIDNKADTLELLASLQTVADTVQREKQREMPLKVFSNQAGMASFAFNPMSQPFWSDFDLFTRTDIICGANGLAYGSDYGQGYYSSANAAVLYHALKTFPQVSNFAELAECIKEVTVSAKKRDLHPEIRKAGVHVTEVMKRLATCRPLNVTPGNEPDPLVLEQAIDFTQVFQRPQLHYFHLSATLSPSGAPEIARLVTYMLLAAATQIERHVPVYLVIDEFQRIVASNLEYMLQLARSMGVGIILANQSMEDLKRGSTNLIPPIEANCRLRQWFSVSSSEDQQRLINGSGLTVDFAEGRTVSTSADGKKSENHTRQETVVNRFTINDVALTNDHRFRSFLHLKRGAGYAQYGGMPLIVESEYHISHAEYLRRKKLPWPSLPGSFVPRDRPEQEIFPVTPLPPVETAGPEWTEEEIGTERPAISRQEDAAIEKMFDSFRETFPDEKQPGRKQK